MTTIGPAAAAVLYGMAAVILLVGRSIQQRRTTGSSGFRGFRGAARDPAARIAGAAFVLALLLGVLAPLLATTRLLPVLGSGTGAISAGQVGVGVAVTVASLVLAMVAQHTMGASWRIGVDSDERTDLVSHGVFGLVRNPIFTALVIIQLGTTVMAPTWPALLGVVMMLVACQVQVRLVEEPYLQRIHGRSYLAYAAQTGRFVPGIGRVHGIPTRAQVTEPERLT